MRVCYTEKAPNFSCVCTRGPVRVVVLPVPTFGSNCVCTSLTEFGSVENFGEQCFGEVTVFNGNLTGSFRR